MEGELEQGGEVCHFLGVIFVPFLMVRRFEVTKDLRLIQQHPTTDGRLHLPVPVHLPHAGEAEQVYSSSTNFFETANKKS